MEIKRLNGPFGAEVLNLDLSQPLAKDTKAAVNAAFVENVVLCFRGQSLESPDVFLRAAQNLGQPMPPVTAAYRLSGFEAIEALSNHATDPRTGNAEPLKRGGSWHTDHSNLEAPPKATVLYAITLPEIGGNTEFLNMFLAYKALDAEVKNVIRGRYAYHAYQSRRAPRKLLTRTKQEEKDSSGCWQPLVRKHPENGRSALYLNPMRCDNVSEMKTAEGDALLDRLYRHSDQAAFKYSHHWRPGDVLMWDNRSSLHQATFDFDQRQHRYLYRIMLQGEPAVSAE